MIKNLNDTISLLVLAILLIYSIRVFIWAFVRKEDNSLQGINRWQLIKDYNDNEEE